jgi:hypothetical protein
MMKEPPEERKKDGECDSHGFFFRSWVYRGLARICEDLRGRCECKVQNGAGVGAIGLLAASVEWTGIFFIFIFIIWPLEHGFGKDVMLRWIRWIAWRQYFQNEGVGSEF